MVGSGNPSYTGRLKATIEKKDKKIKELKQQLEDHKQNCVEKIKALEDDIRKLREENKVLKKRLSKLEKENEEMKNSYKWLEDDYKSLRKEHDDMKIDYDAKLKRLTGNEDLLCLRQLCIDVQVNIYKYVAREDFQEDFDIADIAAIENFIDDEIEDDEKQTAACERLQELKKTIDIHRALQNLGALAGLKKERNIAAHPTIDEEMIKRSANNLKENNKLNEKKYRQVQDLITTWKDLKSLLNHTKVEEPRVPNKRR